MTALTDAEDPPAMAPPPTVPENEIPLPPPPGVPDSLIPRASAATTEPAADGIADAILKKLEPSFKGIHDKLDELFRLRESDASKLQAIDNGMSGAFTALGQLEDAVRTSSNATIAQSAAVNDLREGIAQQSTFDKARLAATELEIDHVKERTEHVEERVERLEAAAK